MNVTVVDGGEGLPVAAFTQALRERLEEQTVTLTSLEKVTQAPVANTFYVAAGARVLRDLINLEHGAPILGVLLSKAAYLSTVTGEAQISQNSITAIFADPDPVVQLKLVRLLFPKNASVGVLLGPETWPLASDIEQASRAQGIELRVEKITEREHIFDALNRISHAQAVLAIPDSHIYNKETLRNILITTYRHGQALIGYSPGMVRAGAMATTTCDIAELVEESSQVIAVYFRGKRLLPPNYCKGYDLIINDQVSASLDVVAPSKDILTRQLKSTGRLE